ncbi:MAG: ribose-5-phosphate isomerase RpiA [Gammaproteobacteria bacterium]|nr:ribose-5-phosphate isomerase RpiA [Gammaproteobacteria bacterium]
MDMLKKEVANATLEHLDDVTVLGVGTGSTVAYFIQALAGIKHRIEGCVASSNATAIALREAGLPVIDLALADPLQVYVDGADEVTQHKSMIKGGGGALTHEKIIATASTQFICLVDESKAVRRLGKFPVAVEVLPMARSLVARALVKLGGDPVYREGFVTDNGNCILDVYHLNLDEPMAMENAIKLLPGVVENGIFAKRPADKVLIGRTSGVEVF